MVHRGEPKFRPEPAPERPKTVADFIICHDEKTCEIKKGQEKEVAENYSAISKELTPEQKEIIIETLLANELLTDEQALKFTRQLLWASRVHIIKFVGKTIKPDKYNDLVVQTFAELKPIEKELNKQVGLDNVDDETFNKFADVSSAMGELEYFFTNEVTDRYADFALFDEVGAPTYRKNLISTEAAARVLAKNLAKWGHLTSPEQGKVIFANLFESFPASLAPTLEQVAKYDEEERSPPDLLNQLYFSLWGGSQAKVRQKISQPPRRPDYRKKTKEEEKIALAWKTYEKIVSEQATKLFQESAKNFFDILSPEQKQSLLKSWTANLYHGDSLGKDAILALINNWEHFSEVNQKIKEKFIQNIPKGVFEPTEELFEALKRQGLLKRVAEEAIKNSLSFFIEAIELGFIWHIGPELVKKAFAELDEDNHYTILFKNPELLQEFSCTSPRERLLTLTEQDVDYMFFVNLETFWEYAQKAKKAKLHYKYTLSEKEVIKVATRFFQENPEEALQHPKITKTILGEKFLDELFKNYILKLDLGALVLENLHNIFCWAKEYYAKIIKDDSGVRVKLKELLTQYPEATSAIRWPNLSAIFTTPAERNNFILDNDNLDKLLDLQGGLFLTDIAGEISSNQKTLEILVEKLKQKYPTQLIKLFSYLAAPDYWRENKAEIDQTILNNLADLITNQINENPELVLFNLEEVKKASTKRYLDINPGQIIRTNLDKWCRVWPESVWSNRNTLIDLLGSAAFWRLVQENRLFLAGDILEDPFWYSSGEKQQNQERLKLILKGLVETDPTKLYREDGIASDVALALKINNAKELLWKYVATLSLFNFYNKKLRNLFTASEELEDQGLDPEFIAITQKCERLSKSPMKDLLLRLITILPRRQAEKLLDRADALIAVGGDKEFAQNFAEESDAEKIQAGLEKQIGKSLTQMFDIEAPIKNEELINNPRSLLFYAKVHENDEKIISLLRVMVRADLGERFNDWKFFEGEADHQIALERLKSQNLLPQDISLEQYEKWAAEIYEETRLDLHIDISGVVQTNSAIARDALRLGHLKIAGDESIFALEKNISALYEIETRLRTMPEGQRSEYLKELGSELQERRAYAYLSKILSISSEEALTKQVKIEGVGTAPLDRVFRILNQVFADQPEFINDLGKIQANIEALSRQHETVKQKLIVSDETSFITALEIGSKPVSTCQSIRGSKSFNQALLAFGADPNTKIFTVKSEGGGLIARSVARLLEDETGGPVLFLEAIYKANPSDKIDELVINFAKRKAQEMGIPLAVARRVEKRQVKAKQAMKLQNPGSRSEYLYTDDGGGLIKGGKFTIISKLL